MTNLKAMLQSFLAVADDLKKHADEDYVLIYQMGKVGSSSIHKGLSRSIHSHSYFGLLTNPLKHKYNYGGGRRLFFFLYKVAQVLALRKRRVVKIITISRASLDRNISMFFQDLPYWLVKFDGGLIRKRANILNKENDFDYLMEAFIEAFPHSYPERWLKSEFGRLTGMDPGFLVRSSGYEIKKVNQFEVLSLAFSDMAKYEKIIRGFTGQDFSFSHENDSRRKWYSCLVDGFKDRLLKDDRIKSLYKLDAQ